MYNNNGLKSIRHMDDLGSSRLATTRTHTVYAKESYAPFGEAYNETGTQDRVFTGQTQDTTSGVYDYLFRKYDPTAGRWLSPDPAGWDAVDEANPQSLNRYAYVVNNPMGAIDLSGLACVSIDLAGNVSVDNWGPDSMNAALCANDGGNYQDGFVDPYAIDNVYYSPTELTASYSYGDGTWGGTMIESGQAVYQGVFLTEEFFFARTPPQASFSGPLSSISSGGSAPSNGAAQYQAYQGMRLIQKFANFFTGLGKDFTCGSSPMNNIRNYAEEGLGKGAILGAFETEEIPGQPAIESAIYGAWVGGVVGTGTGAVASGVCGAFGAYGN